MIDATSFRPLVLDAEAIRAILPHRPPLLLVDGVDAISATPPALRAHKDVTAAEPVLAGHFPQRPVWPGIYTVEGLAQTCALLGALRAPADTSVSMNAALVAANMKFTSPVVPGERLDYFVLWTFQLETMHRFEVEAQVGSRVVAKGTLTLVVGALP